MQKEGRCGSFAALGICHRGPESRSELADDVCYHHGEFRVSVLVTEKRRMPSCRTSDDAWEFAVERRGWSCSAYCGAEILDLVARLIVSEKLEHACGLLTLWRGDLAGNISSDAPGIVMGTASDAFLQEISYPLLVLICGLPPTGSLP